MNTRLLISSLIFMLSFATLHAQERAAIIESDLFARQLRHKLFNEAQMNIDLSTCYFDADEWGLSVLDALKSAAQRGVQVRLFLDGSSHTLEKSILTNLSQSGVQVWEYHSHSKILSPIHWIFPKKHDKFLAVDDRILLVTGRNETNSNYGLNPERKRFNHEVYIEGNVSKEARKILNRATLDPSFERVKSAEQAPSENIARKLNKELLRPLELEESLIPTGEVKFFPPRLIQDKKRSAIALELDEKFSQARESILIETPYLVLTPPTHAALKQAIERGVQVEIFTNSWESSQNLFPQAHYEKNKSKYLKEGFIIYERQGDIYLHGKLTLVDEDYVFIGSHNFDFRSEFFELEAGVSFRSKSLNERSRKIVYKDLGSLVKKAGTESQEWAYRWRSYLVNLLEPIL